MLAPDSTDRAPSTISDQAPQCWLEDATGRVFPLGPRGLIVGRNLASDLLLTDATASRRAAFVYRDLEGLWVVKVGRSSVKVNSTEVEDSLALRPGDTLHFPGAAFVVGADSDAILETAGWVLRREAAPPELQRLPRVHILGEAGASLGGGPDDTLPIPSWPPGLILLEPATTRGWAATIGAGVAVDGVPVAERTRRQLIGDERLAHAGVVYRLVDAAVTQRDTLHSLPVELPDRVSLQPLVPSGGSISLRFGALEVTTWIPGVRYDLLQALLAPPNPYQPGDPLPDAVLMPLVWGRQIPTDRKAVTTVLKRLRRDLEKGGLAGSLLVDRSQGRSCFRLAPGAVVEILEPR